MHYDPVIPLVNLVLLMLCVCILVSRDFSPIRVFNRLRGSADDGQIHDESVVKSFDLAPSAYVSVDRNNCIKAWNNKAEEFFGYREIDVLGKDFNNYIPPAFHALYEASKIIDNGVPIEMEIIHRRTNEKITVQCMTWKWNEISKERFFYTTILMDITHRKANEQMRKQIEESLNSLKGLYLEAEKIDQSGIWRLDVLNDKVETTAGFNEIFDVENNTGAPSAFFMRRVHGQDRSIVIAALEKCFRDHQPYEITYRVVAANGDIHTVVCKTKTHLDDTLKLRYIVGTVRIIKSERYGADGIISS